MTSRRCRGLLAVAAGLSGLALAASPAIADPVAEFYDGKTITIVVGTGPGGTYDIYARVLAEFMAGHIPGKPTMIVQNMPGAGGAVASNHLYNAVPKTGLHLGVVQQNLPLSQVLFDEKRFDVAKFTWIGRVTDLPSTITVWTAAGVTKLDQAMEREVFLAHTGRGSETFQVPTLMNNLLGSRFKVIGGYTGAGDMDLAIERGEVHGRAGSLLSWTARKQDWIRDGKVTHLVQVALRSAPSLTDVPLLIDLAKNDEQRQIFEFMSAPTAIGRSLFAPPDLSADRAAALRKAFEDTMGDPAFLSYAKDRNLDVGTMSGEELSALVRRTAGVAPEIVQKVKTALGI